MLFKSVDITKPSDEAIDYLSACASDAGEAQALARLAEQGLEEGCDLLELLEEFRSARPRIQDLVPQLGALQLDSQSA